MGGPQVLVYMFHNLIHNGTKAHEFLVLYTVRAVKAQKSMYISIVMLELLLLAYILEGNHGSSTSF